MRLDQIIRVLERHRVALVEDGRVTTGKVMRVTGSADHRVVYGADLAEYLATFKKLLEAPVNLVLPPQ